MTVINIPELLSNQPLITQMKLVSNKDYSCHVLKSHIGDSVPIHHHKEWNETWYIIDGEFKVWIEGSSEFIAKSGDLIHIEKKKKHRIETKSESATRLAIFKDGVEIIYNED